MKQTTVNERIIALIKRFAKGNKSEFARLVGISNQSLAEIVGARQSTPSFATLQKLFTAFPQVSMPWLMLGKGPVLAETQPVVVTTEGETIDSLQKRILLFTKDYKALYDKLEVAQKERQQAEARLTDARSIAEDETPQGKAVLMACQIAHKYIWDYVDLVRGQAQAKRMHLASMHHELAELMTADAGALPQSIGTVEHGEDE